jgi:hypothetical protein
MLENSQMHRQSSVARYLLARLRPVGRPVVWAPTIALLFLVLFTWEFWSRPEWISYFGTTPSGTDNSMSREDQAIGAEIDSLPLLMNDIGITSKTKTTPSPTTTQDLPQPGSAVSSNRATLAQANASETKPNQAQTTQELFGVFGNALTDQQGLSNSVVGNPASNSFNSSTPASLPASPLQAALTRLNAQPIPISQASAPIEGTTRLNNPTIEASSNAYTNLVEGTRSIPKSPSFPGTIVPPIVAPSIAPTVTPVVTQPIPTQSINLQTAPQVETMPVNEPPFTAPRSIPGRYIGGGSINTFSNP